MDLKVALRSLWKNPGFSLIALVVLAVAIGANTAMFSVVNAVLVRPLPYRDADRIVAIQTFYPQRGVFGSVSAPDFRDWRDQSHSFAAMSMYSNGVASVVVNGVAERTAVAYVTDGFFRVFQLDPALGRTLTSQDHAQNAAPGAVLGYALWQREFKGDAGVVGKNVKVGDRLFAVIGVLPADFSFPEQNQIWVPYELYSSGNEDRSGHNFDAVARVSPETTLEQAQSEMLGIAARLAKQYPADVNKSVAVVRMQDRLVQRIRTSLFLLFGAVGVVLVIACGNVANLLLARVTQRKAEMAIRAAIGATRTRILQQLIAESLALAIPAAIAGLILGWWGAAAVSRMASSNVPSFAQVGIDWRVALFAIAAAVFSSILFGITPAWHATKIDLNDALRSGGSYTVVRGGSTWLRAAIVVGEITLSMVLVVGATLLFRSLLTLSNTDPGFQAKGVEVLDSTYSARGLAESQKAVTFYRDMIASAFAIPGVAEVAATSTLPNSSGSNGRYTVEGRPALAPGDYVTQQAGFMLASSGYFKLMRIPQLSGRDFGDDDNADAPLTCIINKALANEAFPGADPIGRRIKTGLDGTGMMTIVGVVADVRQYALDAQPRPIVYMPFQQHPLPAGRMKLLVRTTTDVNAIIPSLRATAARLNPEVPVRFFALSETEDNALAPPRFRTMLLGIFAGIAVFLAAIGLYGVMAFSVAQRSKEIGVRRALGATTGQVLSMVLREGMRLILPGIAVGAAIAIGSGRLLAAFVYGIKTSDPLTYVAVAAGLVAVSMLAMFVPARRASRIDPLIALRQD